jgi:hypothetical protein
MIGKITTGKSFKGCILYCLNDKKQEPGKAQVMKDRAELIMFNQCFGNQKELIEQFNDVRRLNPNVSKPVLHITLSLALEDRLSKDKLMEMCEQCAKEMSFEKNQYIAAKHLDTGHLHLHIVVNRIGFDGRTVSDSNNYKKIASYCRKMELKYDLKQVLSPRQFLSKAQRLIPRNDKRKEHIRIDIKNSLLVSHNYNEFERLMKEKRYEVIKGRGIAFIDEKKVYVKGSELGYSLKIIQRILEQSKLNVTHQNMLHQEQHSSKSTVNFHPFSNKNDVTKDYKSSELPKAVTDLIKPEEDGTQLSYEFTHTRKRKKGLRPN